MEFCLRPYFFFDPESAPERRRKPARQAADAPRRAERLYCASCRHPITDHAQRIAANGSHEHHVTNPHGCEFHIGCFRDAPGCAVTGTATLEHTWFPGYAWRFALCASCQTHLGWQFTSTADGFFGLILDRLTSRAE